MSGVDVDGKRSHAHVVGDLNCDGLMNNFDVDPFVLAISDPAEYEEQFPNCDRMNADVNNDGNVDKFDIGWFTSLRVRSGGAVSLVFTWDGENRLTSVSPTAPNNGDRKYEFRYDYLGRRVETRTVEYVSGDWDDANPKRVHRFIYDGWLMVMELDALHLDGSSRPKVVRSYTYGLDLAGLNGAGSGGPASGRSALDGAGGIGGLLAVDIQTADPDTSESGGFWLTYDANGNVMELVAGANGYGGASTDEWHADRLVGRYEYDPYGNVVNTPSAFALTNPMRFSTKYWDDASRLGYWGYRYYDPRLGRWVSRDPIGDDGGLHLYCFAFNSPAFLIDATGLQVHIPPGGPYIPPSVENIAGAGCNACALAAGGNVLAETLVNGIDGKDEYGGGNPFRHCLAACQTAKACGLACARSYWDSREDSGSIYGTQDIVNNQIGYGCAQATSCWACCLSAWRDGQLICLLRLATAESEPYTQPPLNAGKPYCLTPCPPPPVQPPPTPVPPLHGGDRQP